jgi:hypothetical protein
MHEAGTKVAAIHGCDGLLSSRFTRNAVIYACTWQLRGPFHAVTQMCFICHEHLPSAETKRLRRRYPWNARDVAEELAEAAGTASGSSKSALLEAIKAQDRVAIRALLSLNSSQ